MRMDSTPWLLPPFALVIGHLHARLPAMLPARLIAACWIIFLVYWLASARAVKSAAERQSWPSRIAHRLPVWIGIVLLFFAEPGGYNTVVIPRNAVTGWLGAVVVVLGLAAAIWSRRTIAENWSSDVEFKQGHKLVQQGPYRFVRHPIYTSILLMCLGAAIGRGSSAAFAALPCVFAGFWIKLRQEERLMERHFPDDYPAYKARVRALIPGVL